MADQRLPAVYVSIEDKSYVSETTETGRVAYVALISDRGPHNKVVQLNSVSDLIDVFGSPNFVKYGQGHYLAKQHLTRSGKLFVVRPAILQPIGDMVAADCSSIANASIKLNSTDDATVVTGNFVLTKGSNVLTLPSATDVDAINPVVKFSLTGVAIKENDILSYTYNGTDVTPILFTADLLAQMVAESGTALQGCVMKYDAAKTTLYLYATHFADIFTNCKLTILPASTSGVSIDGSMVSNKILTFPLLIDEISIGDSITNLSADLTGSGTSVQFSIDITSENLSAIKSANGYTDVANSVKLSASNDTLTITLLGATASQFTNYGTYINRANPLVITATITDAIPMIPGLTPGSVSSFTIGDIIYPADDSTVQFEVIEIKTNSVTLSATSDINIRGAFKKFSQIDVKTMARMTTPNNFDPLDESTLWNFYVVGVGSYYNSIFIKGVRNTTFDKMYTDTNGNSEYPYGFMDIAIYRDNGDNTTTLLEGPWTVSLFEKTAKGVVVKNVYTGTEMYLPSVINKKSKLVRVIESRGANNLVTTTKDQPYTPDVNKRILIQKLLSGKLTTNPSALKFKNGSDGNMFDSNGALNLTSELKAALTNAYNGTLKSTDGSIEQMLNVLYPKYMFDYIYCGGWDHNVNYGALELAETRGDCLLLADTGSYCETHEDDINARATLVPWNTYNAALYINYRKIFDSYTGKSFYVTPVYHAIDRHLYVDDKYWISEPVAGVEKGAISESIELAYSPNETELADEMDVELNPVIVESDGVYILQQFTTWKRLSILKRQHAVKFIHYCKKRLPSLLKDILNRKGTNFWQKQAASRVNAFMNQFLDKGDSDRYASITTYSSNVVFDATASELQVGLIVSPIRSVERIAVNIVVV